MNRPKLPPRPTDADLIAAAATLRQLRTRLEAVHLTHLGVDLTDLTALYRSELLLIEQLQRTDP